MDEQWLEHLEVEYAAWKQHLRLPEMAPQVEETFALLECLPALRDLQKCERADQVLSMIEEQLEEWVHHVEQDTHFPYVDDQIELYKANKTDIDEAVEKRGGLGNATTIADALQKAMNAYVTECAHETEKRILNQLDDLEDNLNQ